MHILGWKLSQRDGEHLRIVSSCSSGEFGTVYYYYRKYSKASRLATNIIVSSMLILGGSATVTDLTGMSTIAVRIEFHFDFVRILVTIPFKTGLLSDSARSRHLRRCWRNASHPPL